MNKYHHLTLEQRYLIRAGLYMKKSAAAIATDIGCHRSTVWREIRRNQNDRGKYFPTQAQEKAYFRRPEPDYTKKKIHGILKEMILEKLTSDRWSPMQISRRLKFEKRGSISHEAIYQFIYGDRQVGGNLYKCLRHHGRRKRRVHLHRNRLWPKQELRKFIEERPIEAEHREEIGHWERDLIIGKLDDGANLLTIVDRKSRYTLMTKVQGRTSNEVGKATEDLLPKSIPIRTLTNDNGMEFSGYGRLEQILNIPIFFTHPYCSWERGTNENTNGLIREFFPKGTSMLNLLEEEIQNVVSLLNNRPRKILGFKTPEEIFNSNTTPLFHSDSYYRKNSNKKEFCNRAA